MLKALQDAKPKTFKAACEVDCRCRSPRRTRRQADEGPGGGLQGLAARAGRLTFRSPMPRSSSNRADRDALAAHQTEARCASRRAARPRRRGPMCSTMPSRHSNRTCSFAATRATTGRACRVSCRPWSPRRTASRSRKGSGRLELAKAIASPDNPLTARVMVNRVWAGHFGHGLVRTPSDFGMRSEPPTHPELLDWLAARFVKDGWSIKKLHKHDHALGDVPASERRFRPRCRSSIRTTSSCSHQDRRRLDFEALRDSLPVASRASSISKPAASRSIFSRCPFSTRRSVYGLIDRTNFPGTMRTFDVASPDQHARKRFQTTVPQQALFLMNSPFVTEQAKALAARPEITKAKIAIRQGDCHLPSLP